MTLPLGASYIHSVIWFVTGKDFERSKAMRLALLRLAADKKSLEGSTIDAISLDRGCPLFVMRVAGTDRYELHSMDVMKIDTSPSTLAGVAVPVVCNAAWEQVKQ